MKDTHCQSPFYWDYIKSTFYHPISRFTALYDTTDQEFINQTREALFQYCHLDTLAMVRIVEEMEKTCDYSDSV